MDAGTNLHHRFGAGCFGATVTFVLAPRCSANATWSYQHRNGDCLNNRPNSALLFCAETSSTKTAAPICPALYSVQWVISLESGDL